MRDGGRLAAAIDVLSEIETRHRPVRLALKAWGDAHIGLYGKPKGLDPRDAVPAAVYTGGLPSPAGDAF